MKILMFGWEFPPFNSGGLGTACYGLTKGLSKLQDISVAFVLPRKVDVDVNFLKIIFPKEKETFYVVNSLLKPYLTSENYTNEFSKNNFYGSDLFAEVERYGVVAAQIAQKENFDIIHAHDWLTFKAALAAKKISTKPLIVHIHATEFDRTGGNNVNQYVYNIEREGMNAADRIIAVSNYTKNKIIEHYKIQAEKIEVVHNAVDYEEYSLEKAHKLKEKNKIVLFLGRLTLQKGPDYFVYTAKKVLDYYKNVVFLIAGSGDMEKIIIRKVAELGISDKVLFTGFLRGDDIAKAYQLADLYVMPSVSEPFGITPLESVMNGTPVLISKQSGVCEVLSHSLKADFWDVEEMANKIISVLQNESLKQTLKQNSFEEIKKLSWENSAKKCVEIYNRALQ